MSNEEYKVEYTTVSIPKPLADKVKERMKGTGFSSVSSYVTYVLRPIEVCEQRDIKGMYAKARAGEIKQFTGIDSPFEEPDEADIIVNTNKQTVEESKEIILKALGNLGYLPN